MGKLLSVTTQAPWSEMFATTPRAAGCPGRPISTRTGVLGLTLTDDRSNMTTSRGAGTLAGTPPQSLAGGIGGPPACIDPHRVAASLPPVKPGLVGPRGGGRVSS